MATHYIIKGDALTILPKLDIKADTAIVDPPYNTSNKNVKKLKGRKDITSDFGKWDYFSNNEYLDFTNNWINQIKNNIKISGNLLIFSKLEYISDIKKIYEANGFKHHATIIWHKTNPTPQIRKTGFLSSCEAILWATNGFDEKKISYTFNFSKQNEMHNFIQTPICMGKERTNHPTQKPKSLISHLIKIFTNENDFILDCFAGSGTLAEAANDLKRNSINIEKDVDFSRILFCRTKNLSGANVINIKNLDNFKI